ncbi:ead/Ea22-like family protein [Glutamicibacter protophormiae]|uniref:ead/Ea22-like family protein n=1 Tax=Glutamicibacter protophormiae TaxID=37930 RepID=UPI002A7FFBCC|nr:ead/Ea22-like family protein [Glutamicibacter protophormiae]WPR65228.1 ead/Ea22-like family protein [Glutamicibacter protophormiae]WPR68725.1 ead/Ea22-like family protein [Glutamicibacter protophormiae]
MSYNLDTLRKTAKAATPGPWEVWKNVHCDPVVVPAGKPWAGITDPKMPFEKIAGLSTAPDDYGRANLEYIATFNPETVIALLSRLEQAEQALDATERQVVARSGETAAERIWRGRAEQAEQAVQRVRELGDAWKSRGEHSMKYSETLQWPVAEAIHEGGADMVNNANLIYRALDGEQS